jgi:hypothetical protein
MKTGQLKQTPRTIAISKARTIHGFSSGYQGICGAEHPLYRVWRHFKERCYLVNGKDYPQYGGRGITVCDEWKDNSSAFIDWALENGWKQGLLIDRIDVNGNYSPLNCRFLTDKESANNRTSCLYIEYNGERLSISEAVDKYNPTLKKATARARFKSGWTAQEILFLPAISGGHIR